MSTGTGTGTASSSPISSYTLQNIVDLIRQGILSNYEGPYFWSNAELVFYANSALYEMYRDARLVVDSTTSAVCTITTVIDTLDYDLHDAIIYIKSAQVSSSAEFLTKTNKAEEDDRYPDWRDATSAEPTRYLLDYQLGYITFSPPPDAVYTVNLTVYRYPVGKLTTTTMDAQTLELNIEDCHTLLHGMAMQAFLKAGENTYQPVRADAHGKLFRKGVADGKRRFIMREGFPTVMGPHRGFM